MFERSFHLRLLGSSKGSDNPRGEKSAIPIRNAGILHRFQIGYDAVRKRKDAYG